MLSFLSARNVQHLWGTAAARLSFVSALRLSERAVTVHSKTCKIRLLQCRDTLWECSRAEQIEFLKAANPLISPAKEDPVSSWDQGLRLPGGQIVRLRMYGTLNVCTPGMPL
jgi:hypothetical protein